MIKIKIDNEEFVIKPFTIEMWQNCMKWDIEEPLNWPKIISIATGAPLEEMRTISEGEQKIVVMMIAHEYAKREPVQMPDLNQLNFGQFIDCEVHLHKGLAQSIQSLLYTLKIEADNSAQALWAAEKYVELRESYYRSYKGLFGIDGLDPADVEEAETKDDRAIARSWYKVLLELSEWDLLKLDQITQEPIKKVLNFMAAKKERAMKEYQEQIKKKREYELRNNRR